MPQGSASLARRVAVGAALSVLVAGAAMGMAGCGSSSSSSSGTSTGGSSTTAAAKGGKLTLVAYSTPQAAYDAIIPRWQKTAGGAGVSVSESYGASGTQSREVVAGLPADVVNFATGSDMTRLVKAGLVVSNWTANTYKGIVTDSVVVFVVRKGNPKNIQTWADLTKPGVTVLTPNPITSGGARWNILAAYGAQLEQGKTPAQAQAYLKILFQHVTVQDSSARQALTTFQNGQGDVLLGYESEAMFAQQHNVPIDYVIPPQTILIQTPAATTNSRNVAAATDFLNYLWSIPAQTTFAEHGFRPVVPSVAAQFASKYPTPQTQFTVKLFGGWSAANTAFFDPNSGIVVKVQH
jgi:sulfate/thiosulfate transport system substrate-binding protein